MSVLVVMRHDKFWDRERFKDFAEMLVFVTKVSNENKSKKLIFHSNLPLTVSNISFV